MSSPQPNEVTVSAIVIGVMLLEKLNVIGSVSHPLASLITNSYVPSFTINYDPISYNSSTNISLDICNNIDTYPNIDNISGGDPFIDSDGEPYYIYSWRGPNNFQYLGSDPINVNEGTYELVIKDANIIYIRICIKACIRIGS